MNDFFEPILVSNNTRLVVVVVASICLLRHKGALLMFLFLF